MTKEECILWLGPHRPGLPASFKVVDQTSILAEMDVSSYRALCLLDQAFLPFLEEKKDQLQPYQLLVEKGISLGRDLDLRLQPFYLDFKQENHLLEKLPAYFYPGQYGDKFFNQELLLAPDLEAEAVILGQSWTQVKLRPSKTDRRLLSWTRSLYLDPHRPLSLKVDYKKEGEVELTLQVLASNQLGEPVWAQEILEEDFAGFELAADQGLFVSFSLFYKGEGGLELGPLHQRFSRGPFGQLLPGGQDQAGLLFYFHPGNLTPPFNVYFAGYRPAEGFEGYHMMKDLGQPFLLIADTRSEGGAFYLGDDHIQEIVINKIQTCLDQLGFADQDLILSGLSMGSFGALFYGQKLAPFAVLAGKPLIHLGDMAQNLQRLRPHEFGTSLDLLLEQLGKAGQEAVEALNLVFWQDFDPALWSGRTLALAYMLQDDYDPKAYAALEMALAGHAVRFLSFSRPGRHNDQSQAITDWFIHIYKEIIQERKELHDANDRDPLGTSQ